MIYQVHQHDTLKLGFVKTSKTELEHLFRAWVAISVAFGIVLGGFSFSVEFLYILLVSAFTVGLGFLLHELGHKIIAQKYNCWAEFRANDQMLMLAVLMSFLGFVFAAPGAVMILGRVNLKENGKISMAGPLVNLVMAVIFLFMMLFLPIPGFSLLFFYGYLINTWLGLFNMLPFGNFDGRKILVWNKIVYGVMVFIGIMLISVQQFLR